MNRPSLISGADLSPEEARLYYCCNGKEETENFMKRFERRQRDEMGRLIGNAEAIYRDIMLKGAEAACRSDLSDYMCKFHISTNFSQVSTLKNRFPPITFPCSAIPGSLSNFELNRLASLPASGLVALEASEALVGRRRVRRQLPTSVVEMPKTKITFRCGASASVESSTVPPPVSVIQDIVEPVVGAVDAQSVD
ncbi:hypothetical protein BC829DRAFT_116150 [Chytridium lagenaria]|nr:hypothetical protein BC829DRAFT_116150 [Chytridium lagenaria]